ncbi:UPF0057-domain-containing protein [Coemansia reversa NRRL 1564]|uniref:UPF0057-domain-containing protein n=1 Tax=Coemansia reversa (strain ATCC 12441 / NRRL 1564) TaxID=763665 RepID=A0A2G5BC96_COERN|nr:UPF0057-domain-containing protein [Coemansia reversa NRRL 1564]|eukprot:PIA16621.1 UPF0057-domain-containing protein [Coemansia reversa NRRL 1564]
MACRDASEVLLLILAFFLPPVAVFIRRGCTADLLINIGLTILGWIPGVIHSWYVILRSSRPHGPSAPV